MMTTPRKIALTLIAVSVAFSLSSVHAASVIHWTNGSNQDGSTALNSTGTFTTTFRSGNDMTATLLTGSANGTFNDSFSASPGNNPSYLTSFVGVTAQGTGNGVAGTLRFLGMAGTATGSMRFDFAQPLTSAERLLLVDVDFSEQYRIEAFALVSASYVPLSLTGWTHENFSGQTGVTPDSRWATWNPATGVLAATSNSLSEPLSVLTPDEPVSRLVITKTAGAGVYTGFQVIEVGLAGDYNNDGQVDAADYVVWRKGSAIGDYATWRAHFGEPFAGGGGSNTVPEPALASLATIEAVLCAGVMGRRHRSAL